VPEEPFIPDLTFDDKGLIPAIIQESSTGEVLMMAYMNRESLIRTVETRRTWFWSRSRQELWNKGATSGNYQEVNEIKYDCDLDCLLITVSQSGPACHTGEHTCFHRTLDSEPFDPETFQIFSRLYDLIRQRKKMMPEGSYTTTLFQGGMDAVVGKVEEESLELVEAARDGESAEIIHEAADLLYHLNVLLVETEVELSDIMEELLKRWK